MDDVHDDDNKNQVYRVYTLSLKSVDSAQPRIKGIPKKPQFKEKSDVDEADPKGEGNDDATTENSSSDNDGPIKLKGACASGPQKFNKRGIRIFKNLMLQPGKKVLAEFKPIAVDTDEPAPTAEDRLAKKAQLFKFEKLRAAIEKVTARGGVYNERMSPLPSGTSTANGPHKIPLHKGSSVYIQKETLRRIYVGKPKIYTIRLYEALFDRDTLLRLAFAYTEDTLIRLGGTKLLAITTHVLEVFKAQGQPINRDAILGFMVHKMYMLQNSLLKSYKGPVPRLDDYKALEKLIEEDGFIWKPSDNINNDDMV